MDGAIRDVEREGVPAGRRSHTRCLEVKGRHYPPKYIACVATGLRADQLKGNEAYPVLTELGYRVVACRCGGLSR